MRKPRDSQREKLYRSEDCVAHGQQFETVREVQAYVDRITSSAWWCTYQVPYIDENPPRESPVLNIKPGERSPGSRWGWGAQGMVPPKRAKGLIPCRRADDEPVIVVRDGSRRRRAAARGHHLLMPRWSRYELCILHEVAHVIATERPAHGRQFARIYLDTVKRWHSNPDAWKQLREGFKFHNVRYKRKKKVDPKRMAELRAMRCCARWKGGAKHV